MGFYQVSASSVNQKFVVWLEHYKLVVDRRIVKFLFALIALLEVYNFAFWDNFS